MQDLTLQTEETSAATLVEVELGMRFATDVRSSAGALLIARGHEVTHALLERIRHLPSDVTRLPVRVIVSGDDPDDLI